MEKNPVLLRLSRHGWYVHHRASGVLLGEVVRWPDGFWFPYPILHDGKRIASETSHEEGSPWRGEAAELLLNAEIWRPPDQVGRHEYHTVADEAGSREEFPGEWSFYDQMVEVLGSWRKTGEADSAKRGQMESGLVRRGRTPPRGNPRCVR